MNVLTPSRIALRRPACRRAFVPAAAVLLVALSACGVRGPLEPPPGWDRERPAEQGDTRFPAPVPVE